MNRSDSSLVKRTVLACVPALIAGLPLLSWAQGSTPPPTPSAARESTITLPTPAAVKDSAVKVAAPAAVKDSAMKVAAPAPKVASLSDSARAALRSEIERQVKEMADSLKLTPDQRAKARPILLDHGYQIQQLRDKYATQEKTPAVTDAMRKEMQVLRDTTDIKLAQVLTAEQMAQYKKKRDEGLTLARSKMGIVAPAALTPAAPAPADTAAKKMGVAAPVVPAAPAPADTAAKKTGMAAPVVPAAPAPADTAAKKMGVAAPVAPAPADTTRKK